MPRITYRPLKQSEAQLVAQYQPMACKFARQKWRSLGGPLRRLVTKDELISAAALGLCLAAQKWEPKRGAFSTCLWWQCKAQFSRVFNSYMRQHELFSPHSYRDICRTAPIWTPPWQHSNFARRVESQNTFCDVPAPEIVPEFDREQWETVQRFLAKLRPRESKAIHLRYWQQQTLQAIGDQIGLTKERARQVINEGLDRLRYMLGEVA